MFDAVEIEDAGRLIEIPEMDAAFSRTAHRSKIFSLRAFDDNLLLLIAQHHCYPESVRISERAESIRITHNLRVVCISSVNEPA